VKHVFGRQALPMVWDFGEANCYTEASRTWSSAIASVAKVVEKMPNIVAGQVQLADATNHPLPDETTSVWFTDPPYYFAIPYADLSDFFFVWLKRTLSEHPLLRTTFDSGDLTPKKAELCEMKHWDPERYPEKDQKFCEDGMAAAVI